MVFASQVFLQQFLPVFLLVYLAVPSALRTSVLVAGSLFFYGFWRVDFVGLLVFSAAVDHILARRIHRARERGGQGRGYLLASLGINLGLLGVFKYAAFVVRSLNGGLALLDVTPWPVPDIVLPVGISFYTFQTLSYTIDVYRGRERPVDGFLDFLAYVSLFPQLVAGPIVRYGSVADQLRSRTHDRTKLVQGLLLFQCGLAKKVLLADRLAPLSDQVFAPGGRTVAEAWAGLLAYSGQIYFDFSGYSDMALGLGLLIGFRFPINFDRPYRSTSVTMFWQRWHLTLSHWLRDYLYVPLGGNRAGRARTYLNLSIVMVLGGLWHGASANFLIWGIWHGVGLAAERWIRDRCGRPISLGVAPTLLFVMLGWVWFRAPDLAAACTYFTDLLGFTAAPESRLPSWPLRSLLALMVGAILIAFAPTSQSLSVRQPTFWVLLLPILSGLSFLTLLAADHVPFLYYRF